MPYVKDFTELTGRGSFDIAVPKWTLLTIEYGYGYINNLLNFYWRIKGTTHTFRISYYEIMELSGGNYEEHVQKFLEDFREEYLGWAYGGFTEEWMREYHHQYKNFIQL